MVPGQDIGCEAWAKSGALARNDKHAEEGKNLG